MIPASAWLSLFLSAPLAPADLGAPTYAAREWAERRWSMVVRVDPAAFERLWWEGKGSPDPEVRWRADRLLHRSSPCTECHGNGFKFWGDIRYPNDPRTCDVCNGTGIGWPDILMRLKGKQASRGCEE